MNPVRPYWIYVCALKYDKAIIILYRFTAKKGGLTG